MGKRPEILDIIDEDDHVIGQAPRRRFHDEGLLHREIHVWLYTPNGEIVLQRRARTKRRHPGLLDASVGGHVKSGRGFLDAAVREMEEETGIKTTPEELTELLRYRRWVCDIHSHVSNNVLRTVYAYRFTGMIDGLRVEANEAMGFELWPLDKLLHPTEVERRHFIPALFSNTNHRIYQMLQKLIDG